MSFLLNHWRVTLPIGLCLLLAIVALYIIAILAKW